MAKNYILSLTSFQTSQNWSQQVMSRSLKCLMPKFFLLIHSGEMHAGCCKVKTSDELSTFCSISKQQQILPEHQVTIGFLASCWRCPPAATAVADPRAWTWPSRVFFLQVLRYRYLVLSFYWVSQFSASSSSSYCWLMFEEPILKPRLVKPTVTGKIE